MKDGCIAGTSDGAQKSQNGFEWLWICKNKPANDSPQCRTPVVTACDNATVNDCTEGGTPINTKTENDVDKWECKLNQQVAKDCKKEIITECNEAVQF
jgi:hypothetical protein